MWVRLGIGIGAVSSGANQFGGLASACVGKVLLFVEAGSGI